MSNLVVLKPPAPEPDETVVRLLRDILERAERGEIVAFAGVAVLRDGCTLEAWTKSRVMTLLGAMSSLVNRIAAWTNEG